MAPVPSTLANRSDLFHFFWTGHTHDEPVNNGQEVKKMLRSTSYTSGFAGGGADDRDPLTSQPRAGGGRSCAAPETNGGGMDLGYVTERIIAMWFPAVMSRNQCSIFRNRKGCYATNISTLKKSDGQLNWRHPWRGCAVSARTSIPG
ncbi:unnamed protein product [Acanthoscelides obtectus]|uniref:Uncharacterized protein n=1 Tax=Acanthoscelides obtectus TaxID=200917 RepID=A0A9P0JWR1_ACAOB|nr:unnamed protein product [Acanthoscelides obtectus]CAK1647013.1 hypothetical protein AOBTE_LOCUS15001 [Acanthoscelides obtectus]